MFYVCANQALTGIACQVPLLLAGVEATAAAHTLCLCYTDAQVSAATEGHKQLPRSAPLLLTGRRHVTVRAALSEQAAAIAAGRVRQLLQLRIQGFAQKVHRGEG